MACTQVLAEAVRAESLIVDKEDVVAPVDHESELLNKILKLAKKYNLIKHGLQVMLEMEIFI